MTGEHREKIFRWRSCLIRSLMIVIRCQVVQVTIHAVTHTRVIIQGNQQWHGVFHVLHLALSQADRKEVKSKRSIRSIFCNRSSAPGICTCLSMPTDNGGCKWTLTFCISWPCLCLLARLWVSIEKKGFCRSSFRYVHLVWLHHESSHGLHQTTLFGSVRCQCHSSR